MGSFRRLISLLLHGGRRHLAWRTRLLLIGLVACLQVDGALATGFVDTVHDVQPKIVKVFGAGGLRGLEAYQSGCLITSEGHVLTVWSYVLDSDPTTVLMVDGRRFSARLVAADPLTDIAVLKLDDVHERLPHFSLTDLDTAESGERVLAFGNLFGIATGDEPVTVLHGQVSVVAPLEARRGAFETQYHGPVYILDAVTNNPGAAGGAVTDMDGRLLGIIGKEVRSELTNTWLNFALPIDFVAPIAQEIISGEYTPSPLTEIDRPERTLTAAQLGIVMVPNVVPRTPPYIDRVLRGSAAETADLRPDDLIVAIGDFVPISCSAAQELFARFESTAEVHVTVLRDQELINVSLSADGTTAPVDRSRTE